MKKVLLTSTALILSAGVAAAEVTVGGNGRMGVVYYEDITAAGTAEEMSFSSRLRIAFAASGQTDGGLTFGGGIRADNAAAGANGLAGSVFVSGAFGKLTMGDIDSAAEKAVGDVSGVGFSGMTNNGLLVANNGSPWGGDVNETAYLTGGDDEGALYEYSFGDVSVYASAGQPQSGNDELSAGVKYSAGGYSVGLGYEDKDGIGSHTIIGGSATFGAATVKANYGQSDLDFAAADFEQYAISLDYVFGATTVTGFYRVFDFDAAGLADTEFVGLGASYDLGGGAALKGGIVNVDTDGLPSQMRADFGITMNF